MSKKKKIKSLSNLKYHSTIKSSTIVVLIVFLGSKLCRHLLLLKITGCYIIHGPCHDSYNRVKECSVILDIYNRGEVSKIFDSKCLQFTD